MATPVGFAEISIEMRHDNDPQPWYNVFGVETDLSVDSAQEVVDHVAGIWYNAWDQALNAGAQFTNVIGRFGQDGGPDQVVETLVPPVRGTNVSNSLPQNCALLVRKQTSLGGRAGRGRLFMPGVLQEAEVSDMGIVSTALKAALQANANAALTGLATADPVTGATSPMVLLHGPNSVTGLTPAPTPVDALVVDSVIATQRRRLRG